MAFQITGKDVIDSTRKLIPLEGFSSLEEYLKAVNELYYKEFTATQENPEYKKVYEPYWKRDLLRAEKILPQADTDETDSVGTLAAVENYGKLMKLAGIYESLPANVRKAVSRIRESGIQFFYDFYVLYNYIVSNADIVAKLDSVVRGEI